MTQDILDSQTYVSSSSLYYLLQELVPTSIRVSHKLLDSSPSTSTSTAASTASTTTKITSTNTSSLFTDKDEPTTLDHQLSSIPKDLPGTVHVLDSSLLNNDEVTLRIESYGYNLGIKLAEILLYKSNNNGTKIVDILDIMKFVCRDVWKCLYNKQMDNLRTNHRGTFVLVDSNYKLISNLNSAKGINDTLSKSKVYLWLPCGIIRGILSNFGIESNVTAEITQFPAVTFNIHTSINN
ncbi:transport protein particle 33 kDa subunit [Scheffersomyces coipomensis]|uniref:transport protein particle 33 kDa subunit n=1 Tax=Scheffersomyces coipomensis TaxID=1788519 RepID=UPI00315DA511